jgi:hypothetical protein
VGFVVDKVVLGQVFSENLGFPCNSTEQLVKQKKASMAE